MKARSSSQVYTEAVSSEHAAHEYMQSIFRFDSVIFLRRLNFRRVLRRSSRPRKERHRRHHRSLWSCFSSVGMAATTIDLLLQRLMHEFEYFEACPTVANMGRLPTDPMAQMLRQSHLTSRRTRRRNVPWLTDVVVERRFLEFCSRFYNYIVMVTSLGPSSFFTRFVCLFQPSGAEEQLLGMRRLQVLEPTMPDKQRMEIDLVEMSFPGATLYIESSSLEH